MIYSITSENLVVVIGGHKQAGLGHQKHLPIFRTEDGTEMVSLNGQTLVPISTLDYTNTRRELVKRG